MMMESTFGRPAVGKKAPERNHIGRSFDRNTKAISSYSTKYFNNFGKFGKGSGNRAFHN